MYIVSSFSIIATCALSYRSVAEWVKQTENAGVLDGSYSPPPPSDPPRASSPTLSDASFASNVSNNNCIITLAITIVTVTIVTKAFDGSKILQFFYSLSYYSYTV